jgi:hypothetical protein
MVLTIGIIDCYGIRKPLRYYAKVDALVIEEDVAMNPLWPDVGVCREENVGYQ